MTLKKQLIEELDWRGLELDEDYCTIDDAVEYIKMTREYDKHYSVEQWIEDTSSNYPECFK
jgi:hypothetical protein